MRVSLDTNPLYVTQAGVARYVRGLQQGFRETDDPDVEITELSWPVENFGYRQPWRAMRTAYRELVWPHTEAQLQIRRKHPDLVHLTSGLNVRTRQFMPRVITLYDLAILRYPERFRAWHASGAKRRVRRLQRMSRIICISQFTADEAMALTGLSADRLDVVHLAGQFSAECGHREQRPAIDLPAEFLLFVGSLEPGKNLELLRHTYLLAAQRGEHIPPLVIVGSRWKGVPGEGEPPTDWIYMGRLPDEQLLYLYRNALSLVFPSRYEGFGLPPLEAMSQGCPVICSPVASLPEVVGDAACFAEQNAESYLDAMRRVCQSDALRSDLAEQGRIRARRFSWRKCAAETREVYRKALNF